MSSIIDFSLALSIFKKDEIKIKKWLLGISVCVNVGVLVIFKYFNFFTESYSDLLSMFNIKASVTTLNIIFVGISFYTFQTLSYTIDVYRGKQKPTSNLINFLAFVSFFPQLVAGPIERARHFLPQFEVKKQFNYDQVVDGLRLCLWGMFTKVVIADNLGEFVDVLFGWDSPVSGFTTIVGTVLFGFQIYADFSGYSNLAIGIAKMIGFELTTNFNNPYFSKSLTEFWSRWHISLSTWFKDYVYIPLGGNKGQKISM